MEGVGGNSRGNLNTKPRYSAYQATPLLQQACEGGTRVCFQLAALHMYRCSGYRCWTLEGPLTSLYCACAGEHGCACCMGSGWLQCMAVCAAWVPGGCSVWVSCGLPCIYYYNNCSGSTYCKLLYSVGSGFESVKQHLGSG